MNTNCVVDDETLLIKFRSVFLIFDNSSIVILWIDSHIDQCLCNMQMLFYSKNRTNEKNMKKTNLHRLNNTVDDDSDYLSR